MLARTQDLLEAAMRSYPRYGVLAFNVIGLEHAEAIVQGAEAERAPVILQISQNAVRYRIGTLEPLVAACRELAIASSAPVALHLDHATTHALCERAAGAGMSSIMFDASSASHQRNIEITATEVRWAHGLGLAIEGELGIVGGKDGAVTSLAGMTDPQAAASYVAATGVDSIAVAVGTEHGMTEQVVALDFGRISDLREAVNVPLVLHGSSGVPDEALVEAVQRGIVKVNLATQLNVAFTGAIRRYLNDNTQVTDPRAYGAVGRAAIEEVVRAKCRLLGASDRG
jgi:fructose-bisphosphate aldolase class II